MEFTGTVVRKPFASASKSAQVAIFLATDAGEYKLEREEGNPFHDEVLHQLVGKQITCTGQVIGYLLRISNWRVVG